MFKNIIKIIGAIKLKFIRSKIKKAYIRSLETAYIKKTQEVYKLRQQLRENLRGML